jgi:hypothetical protein
LNQDFWASFSAHSFGAPSGMIMVIIYELLIRWPRNLCS